VKQNGNAWWEIQTEIRERVLKLSHVSHKNGCATTYVIRYVCATYKDVCTVQLHNISVHTRTHGLGRRIVRTYELGIAKQSD
jgi:hypothetical protein